jgi:hypothetical protein
MTRTSSIVFDKHQRPLRAVIRTPHGTVRVHWTDVCGDWCWLTSGTLAAKKAAVSLIQQIEHLPQLVA